MKPKEYKFNQIIKTVGELKQYLNLPLYFYYGNCYGLDNKPYYAWIKTITKMPRCSDEHTINGIEIYGLNTLQVIKNGAKNVKFIKTNDYIIPYASNAQQFARTLTREEFNMYKIKVIGRNFLKK